MVTVTRELQLMVEYVTVEDGWVQARLPGLPAVLTVAPSRAEADSALLDALAEYLLASAGSSGGVAAPDALRVRLSA